MKLKTTCKLCTTKFRLDVRKVFISFCKNNMPNKTFKQKYNSKFVTYEKVAISLLKELLMFFQNGRFYLDDRILTFQGEKMLIEIMYFVWIFRDVTFEFSYKRFFFPEKEKYPHCCVENRVFQRKKITHTQCTNFVTQIFLLRKPRNLYVHRVTLFIDN